MPVLVTGAESGLGLAVATALAASGGEVRAWLVQERRLTNQEVGRRVDAMAAAGGVGAVDVGEHLRRLGCKVARGGIDDEGRLELAMEQAHTVMHCWGGPLVDADDELDALAGVLSAALGAGCRRFVWASHLGAAAEADHPYLVACAEAEALLAEATLESVAVRRSLTYGPDDPFTQHLAATPPERLPASRQAPLAMADLVAAFVEADRARGDVRDLSLVVSLAGPSRLPLPDLAARLRRPVGADAEPLPDGALELYARDHVPDEETLGSRGTPPDRGLAVIARADDPPG